jgi:hypothetical protein
MDIETLKILSDISWAGVIALSIVFIIKPLIEFILNKINGKINNNAIKDVAELKKRVDNEYYHELIDIRNDINELWKEVREQGKAIVALQVEVKEIKNERK